MSSTIRQAALWVVMVALALAATACGDGAGTAVNPAGPSGVGASSTSGAVITGRVNNVASVPSGVAAADRSSASGISAKATTNFTVTVVGTSVTSQVDGAGQFALTGVPPGTVQLRFSGPGADAILTLTGVEADDRIEINVTLNGNRARLDSDRRSSSSNGVLVNGVITGLNTSNRTVQADGQTVVVPTTAVIRHGNRTLLFTDLRIGDHIQVKGTRAGTTVTASEVKVEPRQGNGGRDDDDDEDDEDDDDRDEISGTVSGLSGNCPSIVFTVRGTVVRTNGATDFRDACSRILNGVRAEVRGTRDANGQLLATRVELDD